MKSSVQQQYSPINLQVTFETPQELFLFKKLIGACITVPNVLCVGDNLQQENMTRLMREVSSTLNSI